MKNDLKTNIKVKVLKQLKIDNFSYVCSGDGIIHTTPDIEIYNEIATTIANDVWVSIGNRELFPNVYLITLNALNFHSEQIKGTILNEMSIPLSIFETYMEQVKKLDYDHDSKKAYVNGYNKAISDINEKFNDIHKSLNKALNKVLPSIKKVN